MTSAVVLGGAARVYDDLAAALLIFTPSLIFAVNHMGRDYPGKLDCFASTHSENLPGWLAERAAAGRPPVSEVWMNDTRKVPPELAAYNVGRAENLGGSSSQLAVMAAFKKGIDRVVLCGVPLDASPHYDDPNPWDAYEKFRPAWQLHLNLFRGKVTSMSGWTAELLGYPTREWINGV